MRLREVARFTSATMQKPFFYILFHCNKPFFVSNGSNLFKPL